MKNMLITGGCGFIGSNFIRYLLNDSDFKGNIINVDLLTYAGNPYNLSDLVDSNQGSYTFLREDICKKETLEDIIQKYDVDCICHFAAESHVDRSIVQPGAFIQTNIVGTFNLLECHRKFHDKIRLFHHISTDEVYGSLGKEGFFTEQTPYRPNSPYSASKAASDHLVRAYYRTYNLPITVSNCSNNYGPYQFPEKLIPLMILNALDGKALPVYGDGKNIRDWLYVEDHCRAVWLIMKTGKKGETYNIGGNNEMKNISIVESICDILDELTGPPDGRPRRELIRFVKDRPGHDRRYAIDSSKIQKELGWAPKESFESGLKKTVEWYLNNTDWVNRVKNGEYNKWISEQYGQ